MPYKHLILLLPCHGLEDFPVHHEGDDAEGLLATWTAAWHPALIASARSLITLQRVDAPPEDCRDTLVLVPSLAKNELPTGFAQRVGEDGGRLILTTGCRQQILDAALQSVTYDPAQLDAELTRDFMALGYAYLQVQLLTRQMRYASNLDEIHFRNQVVAAAEAALSGDQATTREKLAGAFDILAEERNHYYPVDAYLIDLTLLADTTLGAPLEKQLEENNPLNLMLPGQLLDQLADQFPATLERLISAIQHPHVCLVGGEQQERPLPLLSLESILHEFQTATATFARHQLPAPRIFGRRRDGLTPALPLLLNQLGFLGALHATFGDGRFPEAIQGRSRWEGTSTTTIDALARVPCDANSAEVFLNLAVKLGEAMDMEQVASICLAHWPGQTSVWMDDLKRVASYSNVLGQFVTLKQYFQQTDDPGHNEVFSAEQYRNPYLVQAVKRQEQDPISRWTRYWQGHAQADAARHLRFLASMVGGPEVGTAEPVGIQAVTAQSDPPFDQSLKEALAEDAQQAAEQFAEALPRTHQPPTEGYLVLNPFSHVRRIGFHAAKLTGPVSPHPSIYASDAGPSGAEVVVDVPPMGFAWVAAGAHATGGPAKKKGVLLAEDCLLRNDYFEVVIDPQSGGIRAIHPYQARKNRLSQQLALRYCPESTAGRSSPAASKYTTMRATSIETVSASQVYGHVVAKGHLLDEGNQPVADFVQSYHLWRGSRVVELDIELNPYQPVEGAPWENYYAARFAWKDEGASLWRTVHQGRQPVSSNRFEAPHYIEIENGQQRTTILTGGVPFHQAQGLHMLDSLLVTAGESAHRFRLGIGLELSHPYQQALSLVAPETVVWQQAPPPSPAVTGWLFHLNAKNVIATSWRPLATDKAGHVVGFAVRLLETLGRPAQVSLSCFRTPGSAHLVDFLGQQLQDCPIQDERVDIELAAHQWAEVHVRW